MTDSHASTGKRRITTNMEVIKMGKLLDEHCHKLAPDSNLCKYDEGWSDERIATETAEGLNKEHARRMRLEYVGELAASEQPSTYRDPRCSLLTERFNGLLELLHDAAPDFIANDTTAFRLDLEKLKITAADKKDTN